MSSSLIKLPYFDSWHRFLFASHEPSLLLVYHPEILFYKTNIENNFFYFFTDFVYLIYNQINGETFMSPFILFVQLLFVLLLLTIVVSFYFSNYSSFTKEEVTIDTDYLLAGAFVESEKEISSFDDVLLLVIILIFLFG